VAEYFLKLKFMSSKLKIFQYHNLHLYNLKQYRIALEAGVYNSRKGFLSVLGSNQRLVWEFKKWLPIHKEDFIPYSMNYRYGHVIVYSDMCIQIVYRIWVR
jgi:hypothetical protein